MSWCFYGNCMHGLWERNRHTQYLGFPQLPLCDPRVSCGPRRTEPSSRLWESPLMVRFQISVVLRVAFCPPVSQPRLRASSSLNCYLDLCSTASPPDTFFRVPCSNACCSFSYWTEECDYGEYLWAVTQYLPLYSPGGWQSHMHTMLQNSFSYDHENERDRDLSASICLHLPVIIPQTAHSHLQAWVNPVVSPHSSWLWYFNRVGTVPFPTELPFLVARGHRHSLAKVLFFLLVCILTAGSAQKQEKSGWWARCLGFCYQPCAKLGC